MCFAQSFEVEIIYLIVVRRTAPVTRQGPTRHVACKFRWSLPADMDVAEDRCAAFGGVLGAPLGLGERLVGLSGLWGEIC